jgi:hypothetical protein
MNSASSTTITVNTALFAAGDTVLIVNQGAGVCTVTAGTATVSTAGSLALSQYETGILYFTSTSAAIFSDYTQSGGASGLTLVTTGTYSASSGVSLNSIFTSTYTNYRVMFVGTISSNNNCNIRWRASGTDNTASNYLWGIQGITFGGSAANEYAGASLVGFSQVGYMGNNGQSHVVLDIFNPQATANTTYSGQNLYTSSGTAGNFYQTQGLLSVTTSYDGLTFYPAAGTITGSYWVYGYQKA